LYPVFLFCVEVVFKTFLEEGRFAVGKSDVSVVNDSGGKCVSLVESMFVLMLILSISSL